MAQRRYWSIMSPLKLGNPRLVGGCIFLRDKSRPVCFTFFHFVLGHMSADLCVHFRCTSYLSAECILSGSWQECGRYLCRTSFLFKTTRCHPMWAWPSSYRVSLSLFWCICFNPVRQIQEKDEFGSVKAITKCVFFKSSDACYLTNINWLQCTGRS